MAKKTRKSPPIDNEDEAATENIAESLAHEHHMLDDHGPVILGLREKKPILPDIVV